MNDEAVLLQRLERLAAALERLARPAPAPVDFEAAEAFVWHADEERFEPVAQVNRVPLKLLKGIEHVAPQLAENTERFARRLPANNALLWGARGMGKSSLVKAVHADVRARLAKELARGQRRPEARRDPPRGHRLAAALPRGHAQQSAPLHRILRRPLLRQGRHELQIAQSRARGRHRGPARERHFLCHIQPAPPDAAGDGGERALHRHQPFRSGGGEGLAVRPLRALARLSQLQPGPVSRHGARLRGPLQAEARPTTSSYARRWNGASRAARARAVSPGSSRSILPAPLARGSSRKPRWRA